DCGADLEPDAVCRYAFRPGNWRVLGHRLAREHGLGQRRFLVRFMPFVAEQDDLGGAVLLLGRERRSHASRPGADHGDLSRGTHGHSGPALRIAPRPASPPATPTASPRYIRRQWR